MKDELYPYCTSCPVFFRIIQRPEKTVGFFLSSFPLLYSNMGIRLVIPCFSIKPKTNIPLLKSFTRRLLFPRLCKELASW